MASIDNDDSTRALYLQLACALIALSISGCSPAPSSEYLADVHAIENKIDGLHGALSTMQGLPEQLDDLIAREPRHPHAYAQAAHYILSAGLPHGWTQYGANVAQATDKLLDIAQEKSPQYCPTYWLRAELQVAQEQPDAALSSVAAATAQKCSDPALDVVHARAALAKMELDDAELYFRKVLDGPVGKSSHWQNAYATAAYEYGTLLYQVGRHDELRKHLAQWEAAGQVFDPHAQINMAYLFALIGDFEHARIAAQTALMVLRLPAAKNAMGLALYGQAWSLESAGKETETSELLVQQARSYLPDDTTAIQALTGAACCVSDQWKTVLARHAEAHPATSTHPPGTPNPTK